MLSKLHSFENTQDQILTHQLVITKLLQY